MERTAHVSDFGCHGRAKTVWFLRIEDIIEDLGVERLHVANVLGGRRKKVRYFEPSKFF